jgi:hypothetical protein
VPSVRSVSLDSRPAAPGALRYRVESDSDKEIQAELARALVTGGHDLVHLAEHTLTLEEIFVSLVRGDSKREAA